jgi:hypothetical protein
VSATIGGGADRKEVVAELLMIKLLTNNL